MYTRCPSCRSEISFDPPANKDSLPENYRHRIKCPSCGVTIGVKINQNPQILAQPYGRPQLAPPPGARTTAQPRQTSARTNAYSAPRANGYNQQRPTTNAYGYNQPRSNGYAQQQPRAGFNTQRASYGQPSGYTTYAPPVNETKSSAKAAPVKETKKQKSQQNTKQNVKAKSRALSTEKKYGSLRNLTMMIFSLIFVGMSVVSYLISTGILNLPESFGWLAGLSYFDGISVWASMVKDFEVFKSLIALLGPLGGFAYIVPLLLFTLSGINFIVAFVSLCGRKYGRVFNLLFSLIIGGLAVVAMFGPFLTLGTELEVPVLEYLKGLATPQECLAIVGAGIGVLQLLFALIFLKSMYRKEPAGKGGKNGNKKQAGKNAKGRR